MKWSILIFAVAVGTGCTQPIKNRNGKLFSSAPEYNNYIIERQKWVASYITSFYGIMNSDVDSAGLMLRRGLRRIEELLAEIRQMPSYKGDTAFRQAAVNSFGFYKRLFEADYPAILTIHNKKEGITMSDQEDEQRILDKIIRDEDLFDKQLHNRQRDFAEKNDMLLTSGEKENK